MESLPGLQLLSIIFALTNQGHFWQRDQGALIRSIKLMISSHVPLSEYV